MAKKAITREAYEKGRSDRIGFIKNNKVDIDLILKEFRNKTIVEAVVLNSLNIIFKIRKNLM